jgi:hypothetical protein
MRWFLWTVALTAWLPLVGGTTNLVGGNSAFARSPEEVGVVWGVYVRSAGLRFEARILGDRTELFDLVPGGRITRNGVTAQMSDLRGGDDLVISLASPTGRVASRIEAHSRLPERQP